MYMCRQHHNIYMKHFLNKKNKNNGFTLVEALVGVAIFSVAILALMSVLASGIKDINYAKKKLVAEYLAQEGIEYVRNLRDSYVLYPNTGSWEGFKNKLLLASCDDDEGCYFNGLPIVDDDTFFACGQSSFFNETSCLDLKYSTTTGAYDYNSPNTSGLVRKIQIIPNENNSEELTVVSTVYWAQGSGVYEVSLSATLFNW